MFFGFDQLCRFTMCYYHRCWPCAALSRCSFPAPVPGLQLSKTWGGRAFVTIMLMVLTKTLVAPQRYLLRVEVQGVWILYSETLQ